MQLTVRQGSYMQGSKKLYLLRIHNNNEGERKDKNNLITLSAIRKEQFLPEEFMTLNNQQMASQGTQRKNNNSQQQ